MDSEKRENKLEDRRGRLRFVAGVLGVAVAMFIGFGATYLISGNRNEIVWQRIDDLQRGVSRVVDLPWYEPPPRPQRGPSMMKLLAEGLVQESARRWAASALQYRASVAAELEREAAVSAETIDLPVLDLEPSLPE